MLKLITRALLLLALLVPTGVWAQDTEAARAMDLYNRGMAHFQLEEYDAAISKWEEGFRLKPVPEFLYNIAQAHRVSHRNEKALSFYRKYLRMNPKAPNRVEVERHIASLQKIVDQEQQAGSAPPINTLPAPVSKPEASDASMSSGKPAAVAPPPAAAAATPPAPAATPPAPAVAAAAPAPSRAVASKPAATSGDSLTARADLTAQPIATSKPAYRKGWFWGVMGGAVAVAAGAVVLGVVLSSSGDSTKTLPPLRY